MPKLSEEDREILERILNALKHYECFIYEAEEHKKVTTVLKKFKLDKLVRVTYADPRYPHIYLLKARDLDIERDCTVKIDGLFREGRISDEDYYMRRDELIRQCINHYLYERTREIINMIERILKGDEGVRRIFEELSKRNK
jgi:hypothetical protein